MDKRLGVGLREQLGEILLRKGRLDPAQLSEAVAASILAGQRLGDYLVAKGLAYEDEIAQALADQFGLRYTILDRGLVDRDVALLIPETVARRLNVLALRATEESLMVAVSDPTHVLATDELKMVVHRELCLVVSEQTAIKQAIDRVYGSERLVFENRSAEALPVEAAPALASIDAVELTADTAPAIETVNAILRQAIGLKASDVHFIPRRDDMLVRVRVDGVMCDLETINRDIRGAATARLKVMGKLDIAERRLPQDGRASVTFGETQTDLRVAVLPSTWGEDVVVRVMYLGTSGTRKLSDLHLDRQADAILGHALSQPNGTILLCGPTGAGKTATLYAALQSVNTGERSIVTIEDPVEATLEAAVQVQTNDKAGLTFARGLRTILRADPDVILIGEIRDVETAEIAMQAAMTGHLVLSSVHAQSAPAALTRLRQMGLPPNLIDSAVTCVISQRLLRKPCATCWEGTIVPEEEVVAAGLTAGTTLHRPRGCFACKRTGYAGRIAVFESLLLTDKIRAAATQGSTQQIAAAAAQEGMRTLRENALQLCRDGETTLDEVRRVCGDTPEGRLKGVAGSADEPLGTSSELRRQDAA